MYDETVAKKGQNEIISFLHYFINNILSKSVTTLYLFSDNCIAQNKNKVLFQYLSAVVSTSTNKLTNITHRYPEPGHSFLPCDRCFGHIEKNRRKVERVYLPQEYEDLVKNTNSRFNIIQVTQNMIYNFNAYLSPLCKKVISNTNKVKFTVMAYRYLEYRDTGVFCSVSANGISKEHYVLEKSGQKLVLGNEIPKLYTEPIKIKKEKFDDVLQLAIKYVPKQRFYLNLKAQDETITANTIDSDYD